MSNSYVLRCCHILYIFFGSSWKAELWAFCHTFLISSEISFHCCFLLLYLCKTRRTDIFWFSSNPLIDTSVTIPTYMPTSRLCRTWIYDFIPGSSNVVSTNSSRLSSLSSPQGSFFMKIRMMKPRSGESRIEKTNHLQNERFLCVANQPTSDEVTAAQKKNTIQVWKSCGMSMSS